MDDTYVLLDRDGKVIDASSTPGILYNKKSQLGSGYTISRVAMSKIEDLNTPSSRPMATIEDLRNQDPNMAILADEKQTELGQMETNPLQGIDTVRVMASTTAAAKEKKISKRDFQLKKLFLQYLNKYSRNVEKFKRYPKQIKQEPAWFYDALDLFKENEISSVDKKRIISFFSALKDYKSQNEPGSMMPEEEANRQYGMMSPYSENPPTAEFEGESDMESIDTGRISQGMKDQLAEQQSQREQPEDTYISQTPQQSSGNDLGIGKLNLSGDQSFISGYITPFKSSITPTQSTPSMQPQLKPKVALASVGGSFGDTLSGAMFGTKPQPRVEQVSAPITARKTQQPKVSVNRTMPHLGKYNNIEVPRLGKSSNGIDIPRIGKPTKTTNNITIKPINLGKQQSKKNIDKYNIMRDFNSIGRNKGSIDIPNINSNKKSISLSSGINGIPNINANKKPTSVSNGVKGSINDVVGNINKLKGQVRGEFKNSGMNKLKGKKKSNEIDVINKLNHQTNSKVSRSALECKMVPRLKEQCGKLFSNNKITQEVGKFKTDMKGISKMVPTVSGDRARISEIDILGSSINAGIDNSNVHQARDMYKKSGSTKMMSVGRIDYDYGFLKGKPNKRHNIDEYEEVEV
jgi:hypothetical protein